MNNEFNINAVKVVKTTAGDHLYIRFVEISCPTWLSATIKHKNLAQQCARLVANCRKPTNRAIPQNCRFQKAKHQNLKRCSPTTRTQPIKSRLYEILKLVLPNFWIHFLLVLFIAPLNYLDKIGDLMDIQSIVMFGPEWTGFSKYHQPTVPQRFQLQHLWWPADCIIITVIVVIVIIIIIAIFNFKNDPSIQSK